MKTKKISFLVLLLFTTVVGEALACGTEFPTTVNGPDIIKRKKTFTYTMSMSPGYMNSPFAGPYVDTEWTFNGVVVGYGPTLTLNTSQSPFSEMTNGVFNLKDGTYTLTGKNSFGNQPECYGCVTNSVYSKTVRLASPDLQFHSPGLDANAGAQFFENSTIGFSLRALNTGDIESDATTGKIYWSIDRNIDSGDFLGATINIGSIPANDMIEASAQNVSVRTPRLIEDMGLPWGTTASALFVIFIIDPDNTQPEESETNNIKNNNLHTVKKVGSGLLAEDNYDNLITVTDFSNKVYWKAGREAFDISMLGKGLYVFKYRIGDRVEAKKVVIE